MKTIVVTGAAGILGSATVKVLTDRGHRVLALDAAPVPRNAPPKGVPYFGGHDLTSDAGAQAAVAAIRDTAPEIDALIHIAGGFAWEEVGSGSAATWQKMFDTNLKTAVNITQAALPLIGGPGSITYVGAAAANKAARGMGAYAASKAGIRSLTESLSDELATRKIRVNAVQPLIIDTPQNRKDMPDADFSAWTTPGAIANVFAFLVSDEAACISGASIPVTFAA